MSGGAERTDAEEMDESPEDDDDELAVVNELEESGETFVSIFCPIFREAVIVEDSSDSDSDEQNSVVSWSIIIFFFV
jgi:hypothetical protein